MEAEVFNLGDELVKMKREGLITLEEKKAPSLYPKEGVLARYVDYATDVTDAPRIFHLAGALMTIATVCGNRVYFPFGHMKIYPVLWTILLAQSSTYRKTTALNISKHILRKSERGHIYPNEGSPEAFLDVWEEHPQGLLTHSEFGSFMASTGKNYMMGIVELLTDLYDCPEVYEKTLRKKAQGKFSWRIENPCINWFSASTLDWFVKNLKESDLGGGFLARFLLIPAYSKEKTHVFPPGEDIDTKAGLLYHIDEIDKNLNTTDGAMSLDREAEAAHREWFYRNERDTETHEKKPFISGFCNRLDKTVLKIAMLHCISRTKGQDRIITLEDITFANRFADFVKDNLKRLLGEELVFTREMRDRKKVLDLIKARPGILKGELLRAAHMTAKQLDEVLRTLFEEESIRAESTKGPGRKGKGHYAI